MEDKQLEKIYSLRKKLHENPEESEKEFITKRILMDFLKDNTNLEIVDKGRWFYALHKEENPHETIAFRADFDAIVSEDGKAFHGCGHDGHSANLAGLALSLEGVETGNNIVFLFQHAEENGAGAVECVELFDEVKVDRIYGLHNTPGIPLGEVSTRYGTMNCASKGVLIRLEGKQSHASEPENGINPVYTLARLAKELEYLSEFQEFGAPREREGISFTDMVLATIVYMKVGEKAFGVSPSTGLMGLTIRAVTDKDLSSLDKYIEEFISKEAKTHNMKYTIEYTDEFPDTTNDNEITEKFIDLMKEKNIPFKLLQDPRRGSEDFGHYTKKFPGCFFRIGSGEHSPPLHTVDFEYPDELIPKAIEIFTLIANTKY